jgi:membrane associated rhomboid family serine protease
MRERLSWLLVFVALLWAIELVDLILGGTLDRYGIAPRRLDRAWTILVAPLLHFGFFHLIANTVPLLVLGGILLLRRAGDFLVVSVLATLVGGAGVWLLGRPNSIHLGASVLVFGYLGALLLRGFFDRSLVSLGVSLVVGMLYGGALWGLLPLRFGVSWEGHLFGFLGGALAARLLSSQPGRRAGAPRVGGQDGADGAWL